MRPVALAVPGRRRATPWLPAPAYLACFCSTFQSLKLRFPSFCFHSIPLMAFSLCKLCCNVFILLVLRHTLLTAALVITFVPSVGSTLCLLQRCYSELSFIFCVAQQRIVVILSGNCVILMSHPLKVLVFVSLHKSAENIKKYCFLCEQYAQLLVYFCLQNVNVKQ